MRCACWASATVSATWALQRRATRHTHGHRSLRPGTQIVHSNRQVCRNTAFLRCAKASCTQLCSVSVSPPSLPLCTSGSSAGPTKTTALGVVQDALCCEGEREHTVHSLPQQRYAPHLGARRMTTVFKLVRRVSGRVLAFPWLHLMLPSCCECECYSHMAAFPFPLKSPGWSAGTC